MAKSKQSQDAQELNDLLKDVLKTQKQINEERIKDLDITRSINDEVTDGLKALNKESDFKSAIRRSLKEINKLSEQNFDLSELDLKLSSNKEDISKRQNALNKSQLSLLREQTYVNKKINTLLSEKAGATIDEQKAIDKQIESFERVQKGLTEAVISSDQYSKNLKGAAAGVDKLNKLIVPNAFKGLSEIVKDIPGLRKLSGPFEAMSSASKDTASRMTKINIQRQAAGKEPMFSQAQIGLKSLTSGFSALGPVIKKALGPFALISMAVEAIQFFIGAMFAADERVTKLAKGMMLTKDEARGVYNSLKDTKLEMDSIYNTTKDVTEAYTDLIELTEFVTSATNEMIESQIILTKNLGLSKEEAFGVQEAFVASNVEANIGKDIVYDQIAAFANQNKLISTGKKIFADIAKTSKLIQINFNGNLGSLVKTTLEAKKLGLTLDQVSKIGSSLLDFEQSISSELEAELLTGKDLNLEKARSYALNHDIAGLTQEIANQGITQEKFAAMNVIQQEAMAKSLGMSADEMGDMLYKGKVLNKVGGDTLKNLRERAKVSGDINLQNKVAALEQGILSGKSLEEAEKSTSAQEKFNQALEQAKEVFSDFVDGEYLNDLADIIKGFVNWWTGDTDETRKLKKQIKTEENPTKRKELQFQLDLEQNEGVNAVDTKNAYEATKRGEITPMGPGPKFAAGGIVTKRIDNATLGEAGPEAVIPLGQLMGEFKEMKQILTAILNKEGTIVLNGTKMGTAMAVGSYRTQ